MNLVKCSQGHFYDADQYASCPHCSVHTQAGDSATIAMPSGRASAGAGEPVTMARPAVDDPVTQKSPAMPAPAPAPASSMSLDDVITGVQNGTLGSLPDEGGMTVSYYSQKISKPVLAEPVVGWLVCTAGKYFGQSFQLKSGRNFIGRSTTMDVALDGEATVSRERHAVIIYEPRQRMFIAQPGDSRELFYLNDKVVLDNVVLKPYDVLSLGKVNLMLIPCCTKEFAWEDLEKDEKKDEKE